MDPGRGERKLAAILSADAVGYSRLMAEDEAGTIQTLHAYREAIRSLVEQHHGRVVDAPGDNLLAEFPSALDAVQCAVESQEVLRVRNQSLPENRRMLFRIGVHLGDVTLRGDRIYGDGVNVAARLEGLAEAGGIVVSGEVYRQVEGKLKLACADLGEQSVKNIPRPVRAYRVRVERAAASPEFESRGGTRALLAIAVLLTLGLGAFALWKLGPTRGSPTTSSPSLRVSGFSGAPAIAVLPFENMSGDPEQEYFADGIAEDLITRLSGWRSFPVIARNSSFVYKGRVVDVKQVGRELGARFVVEGSVRRAGDRVRVSAQLIDATTGHHIWANTYDRELRDIFALQDEITGEIVTSMNPELSRFEQERVMRQEPRNLDSYESVLRGFWHFFKLTEDDNAKARSLFQRAAGLDPHYPAALAGIASTHYADIAAEWSDSPARSAVELEEAAKRCIALDDRYAPCHAVMGLVSRAAGQLDEEIAAYERAVQLNPSLAAAHGFLGRALASAGRPDEAIDNLERAMRLSPHDPLMWSYLEGVGAAHFAAERYDEAVDWASRSVRANSNSSLSWRLLAASYAQNGRLDEARAALDESSQLAPRYSMDDAKRLLATADPSFRERFIDGLRKAGLKE